MDGGQEGLTESVGRQSSVVRCLHLARATFVEMEVSDEQRTTDD